MPRFTRFRAPGARSNPAIAEDFARLIAAGKTHKVAMTACMRKLLTILNALVPDDMLWGEKKVAPPNDPTIILDFQHSRSVVIPLFTSETAPA